MYLIVLVATPDIWVAILTFGINSGAYVAEIMRAGINAGVVGDLLTTLGSTVAQDKAMIEEAGLEF